MLRKSALFLMLVLPAFTALAAGGIGAAAATGGRSSPPTVRGLAFNSVRAPATALQARTAAASTGTCDGSFDVVASPNGTGHNDVFATSVISANDIWAVGVQTDASGHDRTLAEHWNGTSWAIAPTPNPGPTNNDLNSVAAIASNDVWAVGDYGPDIYGNWMTFMTHWNGSSWTLASQTPFTSGFLLGVTAVATNNVWAVGTDGVGHVTIIYWNGSAWQASLTVPSGPAIWDNELFYVAAFSANDIWAVGEDEATSTSPLQSLAEHYDGSTWSVIATPNFTGSNVIVGVAPLEGGHAVGVGYGGFVSGVSSAVAATWDLHASSPASAAELPSQGTGDNLLEMVAVSGAAVWAVGFWRATVSSPRQTLAWQGAWNSSTHTLTWGSVGTSASPGSANNVLFDVKAVSPSVFWAVGYANSGGFDMSLMESYCGLQFSITAPTNVYTGTNFSLNVTAKNPNGTTNTAYRGTVHFTSTDPGAVLPGDYAFTSLDAGTHTFSGVALNTPYARTITAADTVTPFVLASAPFTVWCPGACPGVAGTPSSRDVNPGSTSATDSRSTVPSSGASSPGPIGTRVAHFRSPGNASLGPATVPAADGNLGTSSSAAATQATATTDGPVQTVAVPAALAAGPMNRAGNAQQPRSSQASAAGWEVTAVGAGAVGLLTLLFVAVRRRNNRRLNASSKP